MRRSIVILFLMLSGMAGQANAERGDQYWMAKAGVTIFDHEDSPDILQAVNFTYGYGITSAIAAEVDYQQSIGGGGYSKTAGSQPEKGEFSYKLASVGAAYRYVFYESLYFRAKAAFAFGDEERTSSIASTNTSDVTNLTGSLALGALAGDVIGSSLTLELEYIKQSKSLSSFMLGANVTF